MPNATRPTLMIVGGSVRAAAADAVAAGYRVVGIDRFGDRDLQAIVDHWYPLDDHWQRQLARWPAAPIVATGGFPWRSMQALRDRLIAFPAPDRFQALRDPQALRQVAERCGIDFPRTVPGSRPFTARAAAAQPSPPGRWLLKPRYGTGGIGIREASARSLAGDAPAGAEPTDLQQWVGGRPLGACYFARLCRDRRLTQFLGAFDGITHRQHREWRWLYGGSFGPRHMSAAGQEQLERLGTELAAHFNLVGLFNVDLLRRRDGSLVLLEINPRYSASMELLRFPASGSQPGPWASLIDWHLAAYEEHAGQIDHDVADRRTELAFSAGSPPSRSDFTAAHSQPIAHESACKRIVYASAPMQLDCSAETLAQRFAQAAETQLGVRVSFHDLPPLGTTVPAGAPALSVIVRGPQDGLTLRRTAQRIAADLRRGLRAP